MVATSTLLASVRYVVADTSSCSVCLALLQPAEVLSCPFRSDLPSAPATGVSVRGFVQTSYSRKPAENSPAVSFDNCGTSGANSSSCTTSDVGKCVAVTDGSRIVNRYQDKSGAAAAGPVQVSQSQLFEVTTATSSNLGPPREEPTLPALLPPPEPAVTSNYVQPTADASWWTSGHRRLQKSPASQRSSARCVEWAFGERSHLFYSAEFKLQ